MFCDTQMPFCVQSAYEIIFPSTLLGKENFYWRLVKNPILAFAEDRDKYGTVQCVLRKKAMSKDFEIFWYMCD